MKKEKPKPFPSEGSLKEQIHYFTCVLEDIRSQNKVVMEYVVGCFDAFGKNLDKKLDDLRDELNLKIDANTYETKILQKKMGDHTLAIKSLENKMDFVLDKEKEQDQEIASLKLRIA